MKLIFIFLVSTPLILFLMISPCCTPAGILIWLKIPLLDLKAVSYTHLDVYKRQNKFLALVEKHFAEKKFLVGDSLSIADLALASNASVVFGVMLGEGQRKKYPCLLYTSRCV